MDGESAKTKIDKLRAIMETEAAGSDNTVPRTLSGQLFLSRYQERKRASEEQRKEADVPIKQESEAQRHKRSRESLFELDDNVMDQAPAKRERKCPLEQEDENCIDLCSE